MFQFQNFGFHGNEGRSGENLKLAFFGIQAEDRRQHRLLTYPAVAAEFMKINSALSSSAAVERVISAAAQVLTVRRCGLSDGTREQHLSHS